jgi:spermidine/putrescine transport system permease protein
MTKTRTVDNRRRFGPIWNIGPLSTFMFLFFVIPVGIFVIYSFWTVRSYNIIHEWNINNYIRVFTSEVYIRLIIRSIGVGFLTALLSVVFVYPLAYTMAFKFIKYRDLILFILAISLFSNYLVRIYAWRSLLSASGLVSWIMMSLGLASEPHYYLLYSSSAVILVLMNVYIPYATLPVYSALLSIEKEVIEAAGDLGAHPSRVFREITLPLSMPGVTVAFLFIFLLATGDFVTPELVGGKNGMMIGSAVASQFGIVMNWPLGSALVVSTVLVFAALISGLVIVRKIVHWLQKTRFWERTS